MYVEYYFGRLPCKNRTASGDFLSAKMRSTEKSVFLDVFLRAQRMPYWTVRNCASLLFLRRQIGYLCVKQPATYGILFWLFAFNYLDLPLVKMLRTLKPYLLCRFWWTWTQLYAILQANVYRKVPEKTALRQQIAQLQTVIVLSVCGKGLKSRLFGN